MAGRVVGALVDAHAERRVDARSGCRDDDALHTVREVPRCRVADAEAAGGLDHDLRRTARRLVPGNFAGNALAEEAEGATVDAQAAVLDLDRARKTTVDGVVAQQAGDRDRIGLVVGRHELDVGMLARDAHERAADAAQAVDGEACGHCSVIYQSCRPRPGGGHCVSLGPWSAERR